MALSVKKYGNQEGALRCEPEAKRLLYLLKSGNIKKLPSVWLNRYLADGSFVQVSSIFGNDYITITSPELVVIEEILALEEFYLFLVFMDTKVNPNPLPGFWDALIVWKISIDKGSFKLTPVPSKIMEKAVTPDNIDSFTSLLTIQSNPDATEHSIRLPNVWYCDASWNPNPIAKISTFRDGIGGVMVMEMSGSPVFWKMYGDTRVVSSCDDPWPVQIGHPYPFKPANFEKVSPYVNELILPNIDILTMTESDNVKTVMSIQGFTWLGSGRRPFIVADNTLVKRHIGIFGDFMYTLELLLRTRGEDPGELGGNIAIAWETKNGVSNKSLDVYKGATVGHFSTFGGWEVVAPYPVSYWEYYGGCCLVYFSEDACLFSATVNEKTPKSLVITDTSVKNMVKYYALFNDDTVRVEENSNFNLNGYFEPCATAHKIISSSTVVDFWGNLPGIPLFLLCFSSETVNSSYTDQIIQKMIDDKDYHKTQNLYVGETLVMSLISTQTYKLEQGTEITRDESGVSTCSYRTCEQDSPCCNWWTPTTTHPTTYSGTYLLISSKTKDWAIGSLYRFPVLTQDIHMNEDTLNGIQDYDYDGDDFLMLCSCVNYKYDYYHEEIRAPGVTLTGADPWEIFANNMPMPLPSKWDRKEVWTYTFNLIYRINGVLLTVLLPYSYSKTDTFTHDWDDTNTQSTGFNIGQSVYGFSCQIHKSYIEYTFNVYSYNSITGNWDFNKRIMGMINRTDSKLSVGHKQEFTVNEDLPIYNENINYKDLAAIGLHKLVQEV